MDSRHFSTNPLTGSESIFHYDHSNDTFIIEEISDVEDLIAQNRELRNDSQRGGDFRKVASIPMNVYMDLVAKGITRDPKAFAKWLNDRDNRVFRTHEGKV